jgi:tetratricopeptide (TPR) repeat protein
MYDLRIENFGKEAYVMNRKVFPAYRFYKGDKTKYAELYDMFTKSFELNGNNFYNNNLVAYMDVVRRHKLTGGDISDEKVIEIYSTLMDVVDAKRESGKNLSTLDKIADNIDRMLTATIDLNCEFVESILGPKFEETQDLKIAKKIFQLMLTGKCTDRPLAFEAAKVVNENEPSFGISKFLGIRASQEGNLESAQSFYTQAIELTDENSKKAEIYMNLAKLRTTTGNKVEARSNARKALAFDPSNKEAYSLIGDLYMTSFDECKEEEKKTHDYAIFIAAHKMYKMAGDSDGMSKSKALFPSIEDIFNDEYQEGQSYQVFIIKNILDRRK